LKQLFQALFDRLICLYLTQSADCRSSHPSGIAVHSCLSATRPAIWQQGIRPVFDAGAEFFTWIGAYSSAIADDISDDVGVATHAVITLGYNACQPASDCSYYDPTDNAHDITSLFRYDFFICMMD
jgi:hypothetical protein